MFLTGTAHSREHAYGSAEMTNDNRIFFTEWRRAAGLSQEELAYKMGYSRSSVAKAETRPYNVTLSFLEAFAQAVGAKTIPRVFSAPDADTEELDTLIALFAEIKSDADRSTVLQVARGFADRSKQAST